MSGILQDNYWFSSAASGYEIEQSLRFRGGQYFQRTNPLRTSLAGKSSVSMWVKLADPNAASYNYLLEGYAYSGASVASYYINITDAKIIFSDNNPVSSIVTPGAYRDPNAWYHILLNADADFSAGTATSTIFINGEQVATASTVVTPGFDPGLFPQWLGDNVQVTYSTIASYVSANAYFFNGYMAEMHVSDGAVYPPTTFGEYNSAGVWVPKEVSGIDYGQQGWYLDFADPSNIGADRSGNGLDFTAVGFELTNTTSSSYDLMLDSPTSNFATANPLYGGSSTSNANLTTANDTSKPSILPGTTKTVSVNGASQSWDGTEAGWTYTGNLDFGQRDVSVDDTSAKELPAATIQNPSDHFDQVIAPVGDILTSAQALYTNSVIWVVSYNASEDGRITTSALGQTNMVRIPNGTSTQAWADPTSGTTAEAWVWNTPTPFTGTNAIDGFVNTTAGISTFKYTGTGSTQTIAHGLGVAPDMFFVKKLSSSNDDWPTYANIPSMGPTKYLTMAGNSNPSTDNNYWDQTDPTSTVITVGSAGSTNGSSDYLCIAFASIPGFSSIGEYTGNNSTDGTFVYTGFSPAYVLIKNTKDNSTNWQCFDSSRSTYNPATLSVQTNRPDAQVSNTGPIDFTANGFKVRSTNNSVNGNGDEFLYLAFAGSPFGGSNVSPATAR